MTTPSLRIAFPCLHPGLCPAAPEDVLFLDPGLAPPPLRPRMCLSERLPMNRQTARACLAEMLAFGERFKHPGDMAYFSVAGLENFYDGTALDIRSELSQLAGESNPEQEQQEKRLAAQRLLLLAWHLEEKRLEVQEAAETLRSLNLRFTASVTEDEDLQAGDDSPDDPELARLVGELLPRDLDLDPAAQALDWQRLAEAVLLLVPEGAVLAVCDPAIAAALELSAEPTDLPGWRLAGLTGPDAARPWLDRVLRCQALATQGSEERGA